MAASPGLNPSVLNIDFFPTVLSAFRSRFSEILTPEFRILPLQKCHVDLYLLPLVSALREAGVSPPSDPRVPT